MTKAIVRKDGFIVSEDLTDLVPLQLTLKNQANNVTSSITTLATTERAWVMPDSSGTVALELVNSAGLAAALSDETGTGLVVFNRSPSFADTIDTVGSVAGVGASIRVHTTSALFGDALLVAQADNANAFIHAGVKIQASNGNPFYIYQSGLSDSLQINYNALVDTGGQLVITSAGNVVVGAAGTTLYADGTIKTGGFIVSTLPAGTTGSRAYVTDATAPTFLGALAGGGAVVCPVIKNATAWVAG